MEDNTKVFSFLVGDQIQVSGNVIFKNEDAADSDADSQLSNRRLWIVRLNTKISTREGSIPVKLASEDHASADLNSFLEPLFEIVCIHTHNLETEVKLKCLKYPTTEFIQNGGVPNLLQKIIERDAILRIFPAEFISEITLIAVVHLKHLDEEQTSTLKQESPNVGIQVGNNCTLTLCPKTTSYCHQAGDGNILIINIENHEDSNISIYPEGKVTVKVSSKDAGWVEMENEIVTNSDKCMAAINKELEKYNIKLMSIQRCCIIFVIHLLHEKDQKKISREDGPILNLFRAILEAGFWIEAIRKLTEKEGIPTFGAEVFLDISLPEDGRNRSQFPAQGHSNDEKELMFFVGDENQCKVYVTFGKAFMEDLRKITTESSSISLRISPAVKEPIEASFSPVEDRLDDVNLTQINLILGKYNIQLVGIRKGSLILDFRLSTSINGEIFIQAVAEALHELFQNVKDLLERFRAVELNLDVLLFNPPKTGIKNPPTLEFVLYPERKVKEAITTGVLPHVVRTLLTKYNPPHLKCVKTIDVKVSFPKEDQGSHSCQLKSFLKNKMTNFVETKCWQDIGQALEKENIVTIVGDPGTGKTMIAYKLIVDAIGSGYDVQILCSPEEWETKIDLQKKQIILLDDFLGHNFLCSCKADGFLSILPRIRRYVTQRNGSLKILIASRKDVLNVGFQYLKLNTTAVDALNIAQIDQNSLTESEKKEILQRHLPKENHTGESLEFNTGHFQQCVQLFSKVSSTEPLSKFMQHPIENLESHIGKMRKESKLDFMCLLILAIHGGEIFVDKLFDINVMKTNKNLLESVCAVVYDEEKIRNTFRHHKSGYVSVCCSRFRFSHILVYKAMLRILKKLMTMDLGDLIISHVPLDFLERQVTSKCSPCSELKICVGDETYPIIAKRFVVEIKQGNVQRIAKHSLLQDEEFMSRFIEECRENPKSLVTCERDNQNRNLFAGSILYWIAAESSTKCLLQILNANLFFKEADKFWLKLQTSASLIQACYRGMPVCIVEKLVSMGADLNCSMNLIDAYKHFNCDQCTLYDKNGMTALSAVFSSKPDDNRNEVITFLLDREVSNFLNIPDVLSMFVKNNYSEDVLRVLLKKITQSRKLYEKLKLETSLEKSSTSPLWVSAECQKLDTFAILVEFGFRTDIQNDEGETLYSKCSESVRKLYFIDECKKSKSAHPSPEEIRKSITEELFPMASEYVLPFKINLSLKGSVKSLEVSQQKSCFASLRSDIGSDQNEDSQCATVFEMLKKRPKGDISFEFQKKLLACANIKDVDEEGNTVLLLACGESYIDFENPSVKFNIIKLLLDNGSPMDDHNNKGENVFHRILRSCHMRKVSILLKLIDEKDSVRLLSEKDKSGFTPFHLLCGVDYKYDEITLESAILRLTKLIGLNAKPRSLMSIACSKNFNTAQQLLKLGYVVTQRDLQDLVLIFEKTPFDAHFLSGSDVLLSQLNLEEKKKFKSWLRTQKSFRRHYSVLFHASEIKSEEKRQHFRNIIESDCNASVCSRATKVLLRDTILRGLLDECGRSLLMNTFEYFNAKGRGILEIVTFLLEKDDHLNVVDEVGHGVLYYCINSSVSEDVIIQCLILLRNNKINETDRDYILLVAARRFMTNTVGYLVNDGVNINQRDGKGRNALHHVIMSNYVSHHLRIKFEPLVRQLIRHGIDVNCKDCEGLTPIQYLVGMQSCDSDNITKDELIKTSLKFQSRCDYHSGYDHFVRYLVHNHANYEVVNEQGQTLLHLVTNKMNKDSYKSLIYLLDLGLDVNAKSKTGETPLHLIVTIPLDDVVWCTGLRLPILRLLVKNGATINEQDESGRTPLHKVVQHYVEFWKHDKNDCPLMKAHLLMLMADVLICHGGDINIVDLHGKSVRDILDNSDVPFLKMIIYQERPQEEILDLVTLKLRDPNALHCL